MGNHGLNIRSSERFDLMLPVRMSVADGSAASVRLSQARTGVGGWVEADLTDFGSGGLGLITRTFVPRNALITVRLFQLGATQSSDPLLEIDCRVHRVVMTDRRPAYLVGCGFENPTAETMDRIHALLDGLAGNGGGR